MNSYETKVSTSRPITRSFGRDITNTPLPQTPVTELDVYTPEIFENLRKREAFYMPSSTYIDT